jgi:hypothetical protein
LILKEKFKSQSQKETQDKEKKETTLPQQAEDLAAQSKLISDQISKKDNEINLLKRRISEEETKHQKLISDSKKKLSDLRLQIDNFK